VAVGEKSINIATLDRAFVVFGFIDRDEEEQNGGNFVQVTSEDDFYEIIAYVFPDCIAWELSYTSLMSHEDASQLIADRFGRHGDYRLFEREHLGIDVVNGLPLYRLRAFEKFAS
jgi:hypothetical protein